MARVSLRWMLLYAAARGGVGVHDIFFNAVAGIYLGTLGLPYTIVGFLANERSFIGSLLQPAFGAISDRTRTPMGRRKPYMLAFGALASAGFFLLATSPPLWLVVTIFVLGPLFLGLAVTAYLALLPDSVVPEQRGTASGVNVAIAFIAGMALLLAAQQLWTTRSALVFLLVGASLAVGFAITLLAIREPELVPEPEPVPSLNPLAYLSDVLRYREAAKYVLAYSLFWFGMGGITPFITRFGAEELGIPVDQTFILLLAVMLSTLAAAAPAGWVGDRLGRKRVTSWGLFTLGVLVLIGSQVTSVPLAVFVLALAGIPQAVTSVLAYPLFTEMVPPRRMGEMTGLSTMIWSMAQPVGATVLGGVADLTGGLRGVLVGGAVAMLLAWVVLQTVRVPTGADVEAPEA